MSQSKEQGKQQADSKPEQEAKRPHFTLDVHSARHVLAQPGQKVEKHG